MYIYIYAYIYIYIYVYNYIHRKWPWAIENSWKKELLYHGFGGALVVFRCFQRGKGMTRRWMIFMSLFQPLGSQLAMMYLLVEKNKLISSWKLPFQQFTSGKRSFMVSIQRFFRYGSTHWPSGEHQSTTVTCWPVSISWFDFLTKCCVGDFAILG